MRQWIGLACALALAGCASVARGTSEDIAIETIPPGAEARILLYPFCDSACMRQNYPDQAASLQPDKPPRTGPPCITPCTVTVARADVLSIDFTKAGYEPRNVRIVPTPAAAGAAGMAGNIILGGATGMIVDATSGATLDHCPNPVVVTLRRAGSREALQPIGTHCVAKPAPDAAAVANTRGSY
jgi:hypothetical protein